MTGTSRNIDKEFVANRSDDTGAVELKYRALLQLGVDVIETDLPKEVGMLLYGESEISACKLKYFSKAVDVDVTTYRQ